MMITRYYVSRFGIFPAPTATIIAGPVLVVPSRTSVSGRQFHRMLGEFFVGNRVVSFRYRYEVEGCPLTAHAPPVIS